MPTQAHAEEIQWYGFMGNTHAPVRGTAPLTSLPSADEIELVLPATILSTFVLILPAQAGKHLEALIAQALEDRLLGNKADTLVLPEKANGSQRRIWVCSKKWLHGWLENLLTAGVKIKRLLPEYILLPHSPNKTVYSRNAENLLFRTVDANFGLASAPDVLSKITHTALEEVSQDHLTRGTPNNWQMDLPRSLFKFAQNAIDYRRFIPVLILAGVACAIWLLSSLIHWRSLESRESNLVNEIRQTFATAFPGTPIIDPVLQWESQQKEAQHHREDALDRVVVFASRLNAPLHPKRIESGDGFIRIILPEGEVAQFKSILDSIGKPEIASAEPGFSRVTYQLGRVTP